MADRSHSGNSPSWPPSTSLNENENENPSHIDVRRAEDEFNTLSRQLSNRSTNSIRKSTDLSHDPEKGIDPDEEERFDLREYLASSNDANQKAGIRHKNVGVIWENLEVKVAGGLDSKFYVGTLAGAVVSFFLYPIFWLWGQLRPFLPLKKQFITRTILHESSGVLKSREMCLVLGCPGSGCSTFLKTIADQRDGYLNVSGEVLYAGIDANEMLKYYKGEVVYNQEDDIHIATLTVAQTLAFALSTKTPGPNGRLPGISRKDFDAEVSETLLRMLNISHTKQTLVGNEFVPGVSGGERKRVSIAEMMATRARVQCWDNSTRGLDASTAHDFVKSLRIMTDVLGQTTFVSLYQAGEGIYRLFDKVLVLDQGRQVFYGPPSEARAYFEDLGYNPLPRQSTADYLTGCTDKNERQYAPGRSVRDTPSTPETLEEAYLRSKFARDNAAELKEYKKFMEVEKTDQEAFRAAVAADKRKGASQSSPFTLGFTGQVRALTRRQFQLRLQDLFQLVTSYTLAIVLGLIIGAAFINQPLTSDGAFTRGSVLFVALVTTFMDAFVEVPLQMLGRPLLRKQTYFRLYRPSALVLANTLADIPFSASRLFLFNIVVYFLSGLHRSGGGFWTFHLFNYLSFLVMQGFFRTFGHLCSNFDAAFRLSVFCIPNVIQYVGYLIPVIRMKRWLFWIYYMNPVAYAWQACMENEFMRINLVCDENSVVPRNIGALTKYPSGLGPNQACSLPFGSQSGSNVISGRAYLSAAFGLDVKDLWRRDLPVMIGFLIFFQLTQIFIVEFFPQYGFNPSVSLFAKETQETKELNARLREKNALRDSVGEKQDTLSDQKTQSIVEGRKIFTWENLNYDVPGPNGPIRLLHNVNGYVKPRTLTALMGASGAGKTTCLDVLAQRKNVGVISGDVLVHGRPLASDFARRTAYAEQMDVHEGTATVREAIRFSAYLRQPRSVSKEEKDQYVEEMIDLLELQDLSEALVFSLGLEARKRLTIGVELASKPELLLFLDEPTSGLDAQSAWNLVRFLRKLADQGQAILCTIHQPSSLLFESFDRLLLLERGGETVYFGEIGQDSEVLLEYLSRHGAHCPSDVNPAEYMLEAIGAGITPRVGHRDWKDVWLASPEFIRTKEEIAAIKKAALLEDEPERKLITTYATSFLYQLKTVVQRNIKAIWRSPEYIFSRLFVGGCISLFVSLSYLQLGNSLRDLQFRVFAIFWIIFLPAILISEIEPLFLVNRMTFLRESSSRMYSAHVFAIGQLLGEIPISILCGILYWVLMVYPIGFGQGSEGTNGTGFQLLVVMFMVLFGVSLGQMVAALTPGLHVAVLFTPFLAVMLALFCGVVIPPASLNSFWRAWMYQLDPYTRTFSAMISTELTGLVVQCRSDEFVVFNPPSNQTCSAWAQDFVDAFGGYIANPLASSACQYCQYAVGDQFFEPLRISFSHRWRDTFILFAFFVFNLFVTTIASHFLRYHKR